ncbi:L,D-transpeptidase [Cellulosilyticum ruminicola]|uniref:L,D-transpeptidase n=1 Tax=Cellulosilyticum ruminicola TaxID=425254 RepID=UPI0006D0FAC7|nr:L,D-transpeptidase [Cellulosilyticum ruminicola]
MTKKRLVLLLVLVLIFPASLFAKPNTTYVLGTLKNSSLKLVYEDVSINTYKAYNTNYIAIADLKKLGCIITNNNNTINISAPLKTTLSTASAISVNLKPFKFYNGTVQLGNMFTQSITCDERTFIPLAALRQFGTLAIYGDVCKFIPGQTLPVVATETKLKNFSNEHLNISLLDLYWKDEAIIKESNYALKSGEVLSRTPQVNDKDTLYLATIVESVAGNTISYNNSSYLGQLDTTLLKEYSHQKQASRVITNYGDTITANQLSTIENAINNKSLSSPTKYLIWTRIDEQRTYIFEGSKNNWKLIKSFICSTGRDSTPTPKGTFALTYKVPSFGQNKGYCCKYAFGFIGTNYLYHSIIYDKTGTYLLENKGVLGQKASQGCIRFSVENAKWFYDNMISGSTVYIS